MARAAGEGPDGGPDRPIRQLVADLARDVRHLLELELRSAGLEVREDSTRARSAGVMLGAGGAIALAGALMLVLAAVFLLGRVIPLWASFLVVGGGLLVAGAIPLAVGLGRVREMELPGKRTALEVKEDLRWIKDNISGKK